VNEDVEMKFGKFNLMCEAVRRVLNEKRHRMEQIEFYKTVSILALTYSSETWALTKKQRKKNQQK
jgi:hypothetical protein